MRRFTIESDREFEVAGEVFKWVYPYWEDIADVFDRDEEDDMTSSNGGAVAVTVRSTLADFIERIELFIDPDFNNGVERWRELTKRRKDPVPHSQYAAIYQYLLEVTSRPTPTIPSSPSEDGQLPIEATSTGGSS
jgi:hypothetical protein